MHEEDVEIRTRKPTGAVLSVRVPQEIASAVDDYAAANGLSLSETVRTALERMLSGAGVLMPGGVHGSTTAPSMTITVRAQPTAQRTTIAAETREDISSHQPVGV